MPAAVARPHVQVEAADAGRRHVRHRQVLVNQRPAGVDGLGVRDETGAQSRRLPAQVPDRLADDAFGAGG